jgi:hypothetical protein
MIHGLRLPNDTEETAMSQGGARSRLAGFLNRHLAVADCVIRGRGNCPRHGTWGYAAEPKAARWEFGPRSRSSPFCSLVLAWALPCPNEKVGPDRHARAIT